MLDESQGKDVYLILRPLSGTLELLDQKEIEGFAFERARQILTGSGSGGDIPPSGPLYVVHAKRFD